MARETRVPIGASDEGGPVAEPLNIYGTCVAHKGRGLLLRGASGSGKSALALQMMALGAGLVADDRVILWRRGAALMACAPDALTGLIEARGLGILRADAVPEAEVVLVADLGETVADRFPERRNVTLCDVTIDLVFAVPQGHLAAALLHYLRFGRAA